MRKQSSYRSRRQSRSQSRRPTARKQSTLGLRLLLVVVLIAMGIWALMRVPPSVLIGGSISVLLVILLILIVWFVFRYRLTPEEQNWHAEQQMAFMQTEETANAVGVRAVEITDLAHLTDVEFEYLTGALLEAMGVACDLERVGGAGDRGVDLRGKDRFGRPFIVQCKRFFGHKVTPLDTRSFWGAKQSHGADEAWFVTTSSFTAQAVREVADLRHRGQMILVDGATLISSIQDHWDTLPAQWQWRLTECMAESDRQHRGES